MSARSEPQSGKEFRRKRRAKNWAMLAQSNGYPADRVDRVTDPAGLSEALQRALSHAEPHFIELLTPYEECLPIMPPGKTFHDIIMD